MVPGTWTARTAMARSRTSEAVAISGRSATSSPPLERTWRGPRDAHVERVERERDGAHPDGHCGDGDQDADEGEG